MGDERLMAARGRYVERAVAALADAIEAGLPAQLRVLETSLALAGDDLLEDPEEVVEANVPVAGASPLVEVFDTRAAPVDHRARKWDVQCVINLSFGGDADAERAEIRLRRYHAALLETIYADTTLGGAVILALPDSYAAGGFEGENAGTRYLFRQEVTVRIAEDT